MLEAQDEQFPVDGPDFQWSAGDLLGHLALELPDDVRVRQAWRAGD
jgi:hypothetical protein